MEGRERLRNLNTIQEEILQLNQQLDPSTQSHNDAPLACLSSLSTRGNQLCSQVSEVVRRTTEVGTFTYEVDFWGDSLGSNFLRMDGGTCVCDGPRAHQAAPSFQGEFPSADDIGVAERALQDMRALILLMQEEVAKFQEEKKKKKEEEKEQQKFQKQAELQVEQEAQKAEVQLAQAKAQKKGVRIVFIQDCPLEMFNYVQNN